MDIAELEKLALAPERSTALLALLPGTIEHDYWRGVFLQHEGRLDEVEEIISTWIKRHGHSHEALERLKRRQLLLRAGADLSASNAEALRKEAGITLDDRAEVVVQAQRFPTRLDPALIDGGTLVRAEVRRRPDLSTVTNFAIEELVIDKIVMATAERRRSLLQRLERADVPGIVDLVAADLADKTSAGFGSMTVHAYFTLAQLEELAEKRPALRTQATWVNAVLTRLRPPSFVDIRTDRSEREAFLDRLWTFVQTLAPTFNTLKAQVLYHRLDLDRVRGVYDRARFLAYVALPRNAHYVSRDWLGRVAAEHLVQPSSASASSAGLESVGNDEPLVRDYLARFLLEEDGAAFSTWLRAEWIEELLAEARLLAGAPDAERWAKVLGPTRIAALRDRVDIDLAPQNAIEYGANDEVSLEVDIKNVRELEVKVFRINTLAYFMARGSEVDTTVDLDGMVASGEEMKLRFDDVQPIRRIRKKIDLPACQRSGTYVVELIGNGRSSRAVIRKGSLRHVVRTSAAGLVIRITDEQGTPLPDARVWLGGREFLSRIDAKGVRSEAAIGIPFSTRPGATPILLVHGDIAQRAVLQHPPEQASLTAKLHLERESLVANQTARVLCRPVLQIAGALVSIALLEEPCVEITVTDLAGTSSSKTQPIALRDDADAVIEINIPEGVTHISVRLRGRVRIESTQQNCDVADGAEAPVNTIHTTTETASFHFSQVQGVNGSGVRHDLWLLGKTGEALGGRAIALSLQHRNVTVPVTLTLETDEDGAIDLGALDGITSVAATLPSGVQRSWHLTPEMRAPGATHAIEGEPVTLPAPIGARIADVSFWETRGGAPARDLRERVSIVDRCFVIQGLVAGEHQLMCKGMPVHLITVAPRELVREDRSGRRWAIAGSATLEVSAPLPLVRGMTHEGDAVVLRVSGASAATRVHVIATRFIEDRALPSSLVDRPPSSPLSARRTPVISHYVSGRDIGDEYRYVLERRHAARRPGTMLEKPGLLLNPWALRTTSSTVQAPIAGGAYAPPPACAAPAPMQSAYTVGKGSRGPAGGPREEPGFPSVDFLTTGAIVIDNLHVDTEGVVRIPVADLGAAAQLVHAIVVDPTFTSTASLPLAPQAPSSRDLRLRLALDPAHHYAEDRRVDGAPAGKAIVVADVRTGKIELIDSLARAHQLLLTLSSDDSLREFSFVAEWSSLNEKARRTCYSKYACHELHLFLWRKDPAFFEAVVRPYLAHKRDKTFIDRFLLGEDLSAFLEPWTFGRLNTLERILLGASIPAVKDAIARLIGDAVDLIPPDPERDAHLVATLLGASALEAGGGAFGRAVDADDLGMDLLEAEEQSAPEMEMESLRSVAPDGSAKYKKSAPGRARAQAMDEASRIVMHAGERGGGGAYLGDLEADAGERRKSEVLYRGADKTQEWAETAWWKRRVDDIGPDVIAPNRFWRDLAASSRLANAKASGTADAEPSFLSPHVGDCASSFAEAMCALTFLDLPFAAGQHETKLEDTRLTVTPMSNALAAHTRIVEIFEPQASEKRSQVLIGQSYVRTDDRWEWDGAENREKYVTGEMIAGVVYTCQVVVTNPTGGRQKLDVLVQIPRGSVPVSSGLFTRTLNLQLDPHGTHSHEYSFYFPRAGRFSHFPAHVTQRDREGRLELQAAAEARELEVVKAPSVVDQGSWSHVSQHGTVDDVLAFLDRANIGRIDLARIAWRMHERDAFDRITTRLASRYVYDDGLWRYALLHRDQRRVAEWLRHQDDFIREAGPAIDGSLMSALAGEIDEVARGWYQHLEYAPLINARAHQLGARRQILNSALSEQYTAFLDVVAHRSRPSADDLLAAAHYLLCMDRVDDALAILERVAPTAVATRLQHDYLMAYVACYRGDLALARRLTTPWIDHPVDRWRNRYALLVAMLDEVEGTLVAAEQDPDHRDNREQRMTESAAKQPALDISATGVEIILQHHNLSACQLRFYRMDIELLFSRQPFVQGDVERFSFIEPGVVLDVGLTTKSNNNGRTVVAIPAELRGANLVIEAVGDGVLRKSVAHYAHDLGTQLAHAFGQVRVVRASTQAALPAAYVKVYGRERSGKVSFFKDGYTDLRGRFDFATLSTDDLDRVERFALLIVSDEAGATIVEAPPPPR